MAATTQNDYEQTVRNIDYQGCGYMESVLDRQVVLVKDKHRYIFRYQTGSELEALDAFVSLAGNVESEFDWFDAAVLSYQISRHFHENPEADWQGQDNDCDYQEPQEEYWP